MLSITQQAIAAGKAIDALFDDGMPPLPPDATVESLWAELCRLRGKVKKPKKVEAIRLLLEDDRFTALNVDLMAELIQRVFKRHGVACNTSGESIRWYISQKTLEWNIKARDKRAINFEIESIEKP